MAWDDEDFDIPTTKAGKTTTTSWEDEEDEEPMLESWDIDEEEEEKKKKEAEAKKLKEKAELKQKQEVAKAKKLAAKTGSKVLLEIDQLDEYTRRDLLREAEVNADLNNAADLFGGLGVAGDDDFDVNEHPRERANQAALAAARRAPIMTKDTPLEDHPLFQPSNKQEFEKLRKAVAAALTDLATDSLMNYSSSLAIDLIRDLTQPLSLESTRKVVSTLNVIVKDKEREERQARLKKAGGTATGGAGKKKAKPLARPNVGFKKDEGFDDMDDDDFDDFM